MSGKIIDVTDDSFETEVLKASGLTLVDFWAEWCGPCKMIAPILEELVEDFEGELTVAKVDIVENPNTPTTYGVRGIPTLLLFKDGQQISMKSGAVPKSSLLEWIRGSVET